MKRKRKHWSDGQSHLDALPSRDSHTTESSLISTIGLVDADNRRSIRDGVPNDTSKQNASAWRGIWCGNICCASTSLGIHFELEVPVVE